MGQNQWNTTLYEGKHSFVWERAEDLFKLLSPQVGERILDLGCGTGQLTEKIAAAGSVAIGIDADSSMVEKARHNYPHLQFAVADARDFKVEQPCDAIFSNAVLHWIPESDAVIRSIYQALKPGGRFVAEFGGKGNVKAITQELFSVLEAMNLTSSTTFIPWYFPSIGEYTSCLEKHGFEVIYAALLDRPTPLSDGDAGMANWLEMFANRFFLGLSAEQKTNVIHAVEDRLKPMLYQDGTWIADYRRIRVVALKS
ncbi:methyltransferase domain-containing protein [Aetokthonos hydrillicola Thurmond2011]|jgi:trans-aconitate 2-methyltransferase|uniref:Methyltransferase domain-containing protein n=1 Tax=Aetokthonos hydrillicola Thurmond2011 TaxID=2712845 RepID=A0AAP5IDN7_9CYAN|nr:methyltransferase domain-containing protein [Aetokthonos hydrillicola]MBO3463936.1 methyltransferase domain-containing protein [Aetokthonos hydrillicola CCALA 1050]MBW4590417.1 methyltransferase domain-containing protein [Aetokthonos hydrillicola CCALA 1050]MDR9899755.1 methyltransferase domain-containing protein [Aetokthonos hydrillicola Thurmond2011]